MGPAFTRKYATLLVTGTTAIRIPIVKRGVVDFAVGADWTPAAGDVKINIDGAGPTNVTNLPTAVSSGNTAYWEFILTLAELTCKQAIVTISDSATKAVEDQVFLVETFGNASAMYLVDWTDATRMGLTALPNVSAAGNGGLPTVDANNSVKVQAGTGSNQLDITNGVVKSNFVQILGSAITGTAAHIAAAITNFFDVTSPTGNVNSLPSAAPGAANGVLTFGMGVGQISPSSGEVVTDVDGSVATILSEVGVIGTIVGQTLGNLASHGGTISSITDSTHIVLDGGASTVNDAYKGYLFTFSGDQGLVCTGYTGSTKTATLHQPLIGTPTTFQIMKIIVPILDSNGYTHDSAGVTSLLTTVSAINAKTTNLPATPAATGDHMDLVNAPNSTALAAVKTAIAGAQMDLVNAPNGTAVAAIKTGIAGVQTDLVNAPNSTALAAVKTAIAGAQMDLVNAPNGTAVAAIQEGLATAADVGSRATDVRAH